MKILAVDTSAVAASCAVCEDGMVLAESFLNRKLTHSQTILPMMEDMLKNCRLSLDEIDAFAVAAGPGSFTGLRIGISAVKALAFAAEKPAAGVSTLLALAYNLIGTRGIVCPVMDARCGQVYTAVFRGTETALVRLVADEAVPIEQLFSQLQEVYQKENAPVWFVGDGAKLCAEYWEKHDFGFPAFSAPAARRFARASSAAFAAEQESGLFAPAMELNPVYLRLPQAEREFQAKKLQHETAVHRVD